MPLLLIGLIARHFLTAAGSVAAVQGYATTDDAQAISGALVTLGGLVWSAWQKYRTSNGDKAI